MLMGSEDGEGDGIQLSMEKLSFKSSKDMTSIVTEPKKRGKE